MKIAIITDLHANLAALQAVLHGIAAEGVDQTIHLGDAIAIGPQPRECMERLRSLDAARFVMGNHDYWYAFQLPHPRPDWMTDGELRHQHWTHDQLGDDFKGWVKTWPWIIREEFGGIRLAFMHYALEDNGHSFKEFIRSPTPEDLDRSFDNQVDFYFYGHVHIASDLKGRARYLTPGSLGCQKKALAPYFMLEFRDGKLKVERKRVPFDDDHLFEAFESRKVPERAFIYKAFFGGRFSPLP